MEYPKRPVVSEAFVSQMEMIDRTLIDVQSQPAQYYRRRPQSYFRKGSPTDAAHLGVPVAPLLLGYQALPLGQGLGSLVMASPMLASGSMSGMASLSSSERLMLAALAPALAEGKLATFDPFQPGFGTSLFLFAGTPNIWGDKTASDAAVWG